MPARGKFITLEGVDGSGKRTQIELLAREFVKRGIAHTRVSFPHYEGFFGQMVAQFLNGEFGELEAVDAHFSALLYAGDRLEAKESLEAELAQGKIILADRYVGSNLAHQGARVQREHREEFLAWLKKLEYEVYDLPAEDLVVYLRLPAEQAQRLIGMKGVRDYTRLRRDILESSLAHLEAASEVYDRLAREPNWATIECFDPARREMRAPKTIHRAVLAAVEARIHSAASAI
jgi:dTMP kinase